MGREVRRVPLDFNWPAGEVWQGYLMPDELRLPECEACNGRGYSPQARHLYDLWYGQVPFRPEDNGSPVLTPLDTAVRAVAERNTTRAPGYYGVGETAVDREARRLADLFNSQWCYHLNADDVAALLEADRLWDFTRTVVPGEGWQPIEPRPTPTPEQVNEWNIRTFGHDAINASVCVEARAGRDGVPMLCPACGGTGDVGTVEQRAAHEAWKPSDPPEGEGWQLWETVSEGSPMSPVFATADGLAGWMSHPDRGRDWLPPEAAARFVAEGWAPSLVAAPGIGVVSGTEWIGYHTGQEG